MRLLLTISSALYGGITSLRGWLYDHKFLRSYKSSLPVVSIGNITAGGNGKTPLCLFIAEELTKRGYRPAILSRGYGGRLRGPHKVTSADTPHDVGDEPILMARRGFPVYVARSRVKGAQLIEREGGANVVLLDDGLQHRALCRDVDVVSIFAGTEKAVEDFIRGELLPLGMFREPRRRALRRASLVVVSERRVLSAGDLPAIDERLLRLLPVPSTVFRSYLELNGIHWMESEKALMPGTVGAFAGIANPEGFFRSLEELGFVVVARHAYPDHHAFSEIELREKMALHPELPFVCTEKDAVKLAGFDVALRERIAVLRVAARVVPGDAFLVQIERRINPLS